MGALNPVTTVLPLRDSLQGRDRSGPFSATATGPVRYDDNGLIIEPGTTNYVLNPVAGVGTGSALGTAETSIARVTSLPGPLPGWLGPMITTGYLFTALNDTTANIGFFTTPVAVATAHTHQMFVWIPSTFNGTAVVVRASQFSGAGFSNTDGVANMALRDQWQLVSGSFTPDASDLSGNIGIRLLGGTMQIGDQIWVTLVSAQPESVLTSPAVGSLGPGYSWAGTPHASASVRAATQATTPIANRAFVDQGAAFARYRVNALSNNHCPFALGRIGVTPNPNNVFTLSLTTSNAYHRDAESITNMPRGSAVPTGVRQGVYFDWSPATARIDYLDGGGVKSKTRYQPSSAWSDSNISVGFSGNPSFPSPLHGSISDLILYDDQLSDQRRAIVLDALSNDADMDELWALFEEWEAVGLASDQLQLQAGNGTAGVTATATPMDLLQLQAGQGTAGVTAEGQAMEGVELKAGVGTLPYGYPARVTWRSP